MVGGDKIDPKFVEYGPLNTVLSVSHDQVYVDIRAPKTRPGVRKIFCGSSGNRVGNSARS